MIGASTRDGIQPSGQIPIGRQLRDWRQRRRLSQLDLALEAEISSRHLSFLETGRARPSRNMLLRLAEQLDVPLRARNGMLIAAGFAPVFAECAFGDPALAEARAVDRILAAHAPFPALAVDRHWALVAANEALGPLLAGVDPRLLEPPVNVLRLSLHPDGLAPRIVNLDQWHHHVLDRLRRQVDVTADPVLAELAGELAAYRSGGIDAGTPHEYGGIAVPLRLASERGPLSFLSTTTVFGTAVEVTLSELTLEAFYPADGATARLLIDDAAHLAAPAKGQ